MKREERTRGRGEERTRGRGEERTRGRGEERTRGRGEERTRGRGEERTKGRGEERTRGRGEGGRGRRKKGERKRNHRGERSSPEVTSKRRELREKKGKSGEGMMEPVEFWSICSVNGLPLSDEQMDLLLRYGEDLLFWNDQVNLISRRDTEHIWLRHILHSITPLLMKVMPDTGRVLDIGSGGGLPGIPMKIAAPKLDVTLLDSIAKKVRTTAMLASHITKHGLQAIRNRSEELANDSDHFGAYDVIVARAVAPLVDLMKWSEPLLKPDGKIIALKGGALTDEIDHARGKFPDAEIEILDIQLQGTEWFVKENKRIVRVSGMREGRR